MAENRTRLFCGTSNVVLPVPNKAFFPAAFQDKTRLAFYGSLFNSVEVNSSFYKLPLPRTVEKWAAEVPEGFLFTFKLWRGITHAKELIYDPAEVQRFMNVIDSAGRRKGGLLVQFPASIKVSYFRKIRRLLDQLSETGKLGPWHLAVEFRDPSWYCDEVYQLLESYNAAIVWHDMPKSATPPIDMQTDFAYFRFHGERGDYRGSYPRELLAEYSGLILEKLDEGLPVFAYFNNTIGEAFANAIALRTYVLGKQPDVT